MPKIKIIREIEPKIKEIKVKAEAGKEENLEEEIEDVEEHDFSQLEDFLQCCRQKEFLRRL